MKVVCTYCGNEFNKPPSQIYKNNFCNKECRQDYMVKWVECATCDKRFKKRVSQIKKTANNFCNKSCAATFNNSKFPKRKIPLHTKNFRERVRADQARLRQTLERNPCFRCGYSKHVDLCHIKAVSEFNENTPIKQVNSLSNLIHLCKNCHWEYDNGLLDISNLGSLSTNKS